MSLLRIRCADTSADVPMITQTLACENFMGSLLRSVRVLRTRLSKFFHWHRRELAKSYTHQPLAYALFSICGCSTARDSCSSLNAPWQNTFPTLGWLRLKDSYWDLLPAKHPDMPSIALLPSLAFSSAPPVIVTAPFDHALVGGSALFDLAGIHGIPKDQEKE